MQARDVMSHEVVTVGPDTSAKYAAEIMADGGYAAVPVVNEEDQLVGIVAEADVLAGRLPPDPRLHLRRDASQGAGTPPPLLVRGVMTTNVRTVDATADVSDIARLFVDERLRSVPVLEHGRLAGIVSRRDVLRALVRSDDALREDVLRLVEEYTGEVGSWDVRVTEGMVTIHRTRGVPDVSRAVEERALGTLARTVAGVITARVLGPDTVDDDREASAHSVDASG
ncbi:MAG: CBS domain-containing protein [Blastococcus sp.]|nr:CBS domain-containing protein [Blastococcus sp.]